MARRPAPLPRSVAVTGAASGLGRALVERFTARPDLDVLLGLDTRTADVDGVQWRTADRHDDRLAQRLAGAGTVVHLAVDEPGSAPVTPAAARSTAAVLEACRAAGARRVVLVTSADVYAPRTGRSGAPARPLTERSALREPTGELRAEDLLEVERLADHAGRTGLLATVLRPAALVGAGPAPAYEGQLLDHFASPRLLAFRGVEPLWQLCHADDLLSALELAAVGAAGGRLNVACDGWLPQTAVETLTGRRRLELPASVALSTAERLHRLGVTAASPRELDRLLAPVVVSCARLRAAGWAPRWTNEAALLAHLAAQPEPRPAGGSTGASLAGASVAGASAAGATAALLGTAALVRRARRRRRL